MKLGCLVHKTSFVETEVLCTVGIPCENVLFWVDHSVVNLSVKLTFFLFIVGQQFTIFYGVRANIDLLVHNGFVFESNKDDCLTFAPRFRSLIPLTEAALCLEKAL